MATTDRERKRNFEKAKRVPTKDNQISQPVDNNENQRKRNINDKTREAKVKKDKDREERDRMTETATSGGFGSKNNFKEKIYEWIVSALLGLGSIGEVFISAWLGPMLNFFGWIKKIFSIGKKAPSQSWLKLAYKAFTMSGIFTVFTFIVIIIGTIASIAASPIFSKTAGIAITVGINAVLAIPGASSIVAGGLIIYNLVK